MDTSFIMTELQGYSEGESNENLSVRTLHTWATQSQKGLRLDCLNRAT